MSKADLFNNIQRKYLQKEKSLSPVGESDAETSKFNKIQRKYMEKPASPVGAAGALSALAGDDISRVILRSGSDEGSLKTRGSFGLWPQEDMEKAPEMTKESLPEFETMKFRFKNSLARSPFERMTGGSRPGLETMGFQPSRIRPEEKLYSPVNDQPRISPVDLREDLRDFDKKEPRLKKPKQHPIPAPVENDPIAPEPVKDETLRQQTGRYDAQTGKTWYDYDGKEVWANMETLQGVGVLPDGTFINAAQGDRFAKPVYDVIYQRDSGQISQEEADGKLDAIAWEIAGSEYPNEEDLSLRNENYLETSERLKSRTIDYYTIPDLTEWFNEYLDAETIKTTEKINSLQENASAESDSSHYQSLTFLINQFKNGAEYDLKRTERFQTHSLFQYNGEIVSRDALGNFMFGYVMRALGFSKNEMEIIGGKYQIISGDRSQDRKAAKGDDVRDRDRIFEGADYYDEKWS